MRRTRSPSASATLRRPRGQGPDIAAASQGHRCHATSGAIPDTRPPPPRRPTSAPSSSCEKATGLRFERSTIGVSAGTAATLRVVHVLAAPDKFRGTATASEVAGAIARRGAAQGLDVHRAAHGRWWGGHARRARRPDRPSTVSGPLGRRQSRHGMAAVARRGGRRDGARVRSRGWLAARRATTRSPRRRTGHGRAHRRGGRGSGAKRVIIGVGRLVATTDGGLGAPLRAL